MQDTDDQHDPGEGQARKPTSSMHGHAVSGFAWTIAQTIGSKVVNFGGQLVLARLLAPEHFGIMALAISIAAMVNVLQQSGLAEVLIQRRSSLRVWITPAFWMSVAFGVLAALVVVGAAPLAVLAFDADPVILWVMICLAVSILARSLGLVPRVLLRREMRFAMLARQEFAVIVFNMGCSLALAWLGFGALALAIPIPISASVRAALNWAQTRPKIRLRLQLRRWRYLIGASSLLFISAIMLSFLGYGGYMLLGLFKNDAEVGLFFYAFNLSAHAALILGGKLSEVLLPVLSKLQLEPERQRAAFMRTARAIMLLGVPACLALTAVSEPFIRTVIGKEQWLPAIPLLQILTIGTAVRILAEPGRSMLKSQARYKELIQGSVALTLVYIALILPASAWLDLTWVAVAMSVYSIIAGFAWATIGLGSLRYLAPLIGATLRPLVIGIFCVGPGWAAGAWMPESTFGDLGRIMAVGISSVVIGPIASHLFAAQTFEEMTSILRDRLGPRIQRSRA
jgi:PST family polysaccharide transporter